MSGSSGLEEKKLLITNANDELLNAHIYLGSWLIFGSLRSIIMHLIQIERWPKMMEGSTYFGCSSSSFSFLRLAGAFLKKLSAGGTVLNVQQQKVPHS